MTRGVALSAVFLGILASTGQAQLAQSRRGVWYSVGPAIGSGRATCSICQDQRDAGLAGQLRVGGTIAPNVLASVELSGWRKDVTPLDRTFVMLAAVGTVYPARALGLHVKAGLGGYWYTEEDAVNKLDSQGIGLQLGAGYDIPLSRRAGLAPFVTLVASGSGNPTRLDKASGFKQPLFSDLSVSLIQIGIGLTIY